MKKFIFTIIIFLCSNVLNAMDVGPQQQVEQEDSTEVIWIQTSDGILIGVPFWQMEQMSKLHKFYLLQLRYKGKNNEKNPLLALGLTAEQLTLLQNALDKAYSVQDLEIFCKRLTLEQQQALINATDIVGATGLLSLLTGLAFPIDIQKIILNSSQIVAPIVSYLQKPENSKIILMEEKGVFPCSVEFSSDGNYLLSAGYRFLGLWDSKTNKEIKDFIGHKTSNRMFPAVFSYDGKCIASGRTEYFQADTITLWNITDLHNISYKILAGHKGEVKEITCIAFSPDNKKIVSGGFDVQLILWDIQNLNKITYKDLVGHSPKSFRINAVAFSPDGNYIVSGSNTQANNLILWDGKTGEKIKILEGHNNRYGVECLAFSPDGNYIISGSDGTSNNLILWDGKTGEKIKILEGHTDSVRCIAFSPDGKYIVSGSKGISNNLILWDISSVVIKNRIPTILFSLKHYEVGLLPQDIVKLIGQNLIELSNIDISYQTLEGHYEGPYNSGTISVAFSPDGKYIVSGGYNNSQKENLILWDAKTGKKIEGKDLGGRVREVVFNIDSGTIAYIAEEGDYSNLGLFKILDPQAFDFITKQLNITQAHLLYRLYLAKIKGIPAVLDKKSLDYQIYITLPGNVQKLIATFFPFEESSVFDERMKKEKVSGLEKAVQEKINYYQSLFGKTRSSRTEKITMLQSWMRDMDKNSVDYQACKRLLQEFEHEEAFEGL